MYSTDDMTLLLAVVQAGGMRAASEAVHLSQPAISRRIQQMEARSGVKLFQRAGRGVRLTEAGEEFVRRAEEILDRLRDLDKEMGALSRGQRGALRIGATVTVCLYLLPPVLEEMRRRFPQYELYVTNESSRRMPDLVREGMVDVGIASVGALLPGLKLQSWRQLHLGLLRPSGQAPGPVSIQILQDAPFVASSSGSLRNAVDHALSSAGVHPRVVAQADSLEVVRMLVACGFGNAIVPLEVMRTDAFRSGLTLARITEEIPPLAVGCFYRTMLQPLKAFLGLLEKTDTQEAASRGEPGDNPR